MSHATSISSQAKNTTVFRTVSLLILSLIYVSSFVDRQIIAVVGESIRLDLGLNFTALGWLYGPAFSWVYAIMGLIMEAWPIDTPSADHSLGCGYLELCHHRQWMGEFLWLLVAMRMALGLSQAALSPPSILYWPIGSPRKACNRFFGLCLFHLYRRWSFLFNRRNRGSVLRLARFSAGAWLG